MDYLHGQGLPSNFQAKNIHGRIHLHLCRHYPLFKSNYFFGGLRLYLWKEIVSFVIITEFVGF